MKSPHFLIMLLIVIVFICGCTQTAQTASENKPGFATNSTSTPWTTATTITLPPPTISVPPKDPIIGAWICHIYASWGKVDQEFTFRENNTWTRIITNIKSKNKEYAHGTWIKERANNYRLTSSITGVSHIFEYTIANDELTDTNFELIFHRTVEADTTKALVPTMNITLYGAFSASELEDSHPLSGNKYLVVNMSVKNINETGGYSFDEKSIRVMYYEGSGSYSINQKMGGLLLNPIPFGTIALGEERQGNVIFGVPEISQSYTLKLLDSNGNGVSNIIELKNVRMYAKYPPNSN